MNPISRVRGIQIVALSTSLLFCLLGTAQSAGIGGYFEYGSVDGEIDFLGGGDIDFDADQFGFGIAFDSNLASDSLFNYRGTFGYRSSEHTFKTSLGDLELDAEGFEMNHLLGFGIVRTNRFRVFIGPAIRVGVDVFDTVSGTDLVNIDFGVGPEIGINIHMAKHLTVSPWVAYQYHYLVQVVDINGIGDDEFEGDEHVVKVGVSIFFRSAGDQFRARRARHSQPVRTNQTTF